MEIKKGPYNGDVSNQSASHREHQQQQSGLFHQRNGNYSDYNAGGM